MPSYELFTAARAREVIAEHRDREGAALPILHAIHGVFGFVPDEAVPIVAEALNRTRAEIYGVVTFYHDFRRVPPGRHVLRLCRAEACQSAGCEALAAHAEARLGVGFGGTSADGAATLEAVYCLGLCAVAPAAMLDGRVVGRLDEHRIDALLAEAKS